MTGDKSGRWASGSRGEPMGNRVHPGVETDNNKNEIKRGKDSLEQATGSDSTGESLEPSHVTE
jgi:hypothetical protein